MQKPEKISKEAKRSSSLGREISAICNLFLTSSNKGSPSSRMGRRRSSQEREGKGPLFPVLQKPNKISRRQKRRSSWGGRGKESLLDLLQMGEHPQERGEGINYQKGESQQYLPILRQFVENILKRLSRRSSFWTVYYTIKRHKKVSVAKLLA